MEAEEGAGHVPWDQVEEELVHETMEQTSEEVEEGAGPYPWRCDEVGPSPWTWEGAGPSPCPSILGERE